MGKKGIKTGGRDFKPGQSGNPLGARLHNPALKAVRRLTQIEIEEVGALVLDGDLERLQAIMKDTTASALKVLIASCMIKAISKGDASAMNVILDRMVGRVKQVVQVDMSESAKKLNDEQLLGEVQRIMGNAKSSG